LPSNNAVSLFDLVQDIQREQVPSGGGTLSSLGLVIGTFFGLGGDDVFHCMIWDHAVGIMIILSMQLFPSAK
jgi:hypothetical protein